MSTSVKNVTAFGTGVLGSQIAYHTAYAASALTAYDISDEIVDTARKRFEELVARYEQELKDASQAPARAALARIRYSSDLADAVRDADLVIEAAPEFPDGKRELYHKAAAARTREGDLRLEIAPGHCPAN
jgi:3-hydroxybutyryl-CoA dehydrogenase